MIGSIKSPHHHQQHSSRKLLISCAELIHRSDLTSARHILSLLLSPSSNSQFGDSNDRLIHQFALALSLRLSIFPLCPQIKDPKALQSSYLSLNQITPFLRFAHLTANQAILESIQGSNALHILDFDTSHGLQWPPLLQAIAERSDPSDPPSIRITGTGCSEISVLNRTADRLETFAASLGLHFKFNISTGSNFEIHQGETLAVNCVNFLNKFMKDGDDSDQEVRKFLRAVKTMNPAVLTVAEKEASHNSPIFLQRFMEALEYYNAVFESLEATVPPSSRERLEVEQVWFGREISDVVAFENVGRRERSLKFEKWEQIMKSVGFKSRALSPFALSQARLLLRLHYPSEGYQLKSLRDAFFLGWQNTPLFSVSSWH